MTELNLKSKFLSVRPIADSGAWSQGMSLSDYSTQLVQFVAIVGWEFSRAWPIADTELSQPSADTDPWDINSSFVESPKSHY